VRGNQCWAVPQSSSPALSGSAPLNIIQNYTGQLFRWKPSKVPFLF
jgi:hypothetical protein